MGIQELLEQIAPVIDRLQGIVFILELLAFVGIVGKRSEVQRFDQYVVTSFLVVDQRRSFLNVTDEGIVGLLIACLYPESLAFAVDSFPVIADADAKLSKYRRTFLSGLSLRRGNRSHRYRHLRIRRCHPDNVSIYQTV